MISQIGATTSAFVSAGGDFIVSHTVGSGNDRVLVVSEQVSGSENSTGVTYDGLALTLAASTTAPSGDAKIWFLVNPPEGAADIVVSYDAGTAASKTLGAITLGGVDQSGPIGDTGGDGPGSGTSVSVDIVTTRDDSWVVDSLHAAGASGITPGANQTSFEGEASAGASFEVAGATPDTVTMSWTWSNDTSFRFAAAEILAAPETQQGLLLLLHARGDD